MVDLFILYIVFRVPIQRVRIPTTRIGERKPFDTFSKIWLISYYFSCGRRNFFGFFFAFLAITTYKTASTCNMLHSQTADTATG